MRKTFFDSVNDVMKMFASDNLTTLKPHIRFDFVKIRQFIEKHDKVFDAIQSNPLFFPQYILQCQNNITKSYNIFTNGDKTLLALKYKTTDDLYKVEKKLKDKNLFKGFFDRSSSSVFPKMNKDTFVSFTVDISSELYDQNHMNVFCLFVCLIRFTYLELVKMYDKYEKYHFFLVFERLESLGRYSFSLCERIKPPRKKFTSTLANLPNLLRTIKSKDKRKELITIMISNEILKRLKKDPRVFLDDGSFSKKHLLFIFHPDVKRICHQMELKEGVVSYNRKQLDKTLSKLMNCTEFAEAVCQSINNFNDVKIPEKVLVNHLTKIIPDFISNEYKKFL